MLKRCRKCGLDRPGEQFSPGKRPGTLRSICKRCACAHSRAWYTARNREAIVSRAAAKLAASNHCPKCGRDLSPGDFYADRRKASRHRVACKDCDRQQKGITKRVLLSAEERLAKARAASRARPPEQRQAERAKAAAKKGRAYTPGVSPAEGRRAALFARGGRYLDAAEIARRQEVREQAKAERAAKKEAALAAKPWTDPSLTDTEAYRLQYRLDPEFAIKERLRAHARRRRQGRRIAEIIRLALKRDGRAPSIERFAGFTIPELKRHLERQFDRRMTWPDFCAGHIHIDHIRPLASFDLGNPEELRAAWAITNLRPVWKPDNLAKGATRTHLL